MRKSKKPRRDDDPNDSRSSFNSRSSSDEAVQFFRSAVGSSFESLVRTTTAASSVAPSTPGSRKSSFTSITDRLGFRRPSFESIFRRSAKRKDKDHGRPKLADVLEKPETNKLVNFWNAIGSPAPEQRPIDGVPSSLAFQQVPVPVPPVEPVPVCGKPKSAKMDTSLLVPGGPDRRKQIQDARDMYQTILRNAERTNSAVPPYEFLELIGKGSFGRVYKCVEKSTSELVAVKIVNIDDMDFSADPRDRDETVKDFRKEVTILQQLKDNKARNVNLIHDAFDLHSQLWIISDYCTGGSVRTLMRANPMSGLEEKYIIPIARELAVAMKCVHDIGVIHRDIKCTNVYVTEEGLIQLGDFGIVGIMDDSTSNKRTTIIGTPWYMPREMHVDSHTVAGGYGTEVDIWAFGCTVYEMATGLVPNARVAPQNLASVLEEQAPRLVGGEYSDGLREFVAFCLESNPRERPSADQIISHPYIANTSMQYPTTSLVELIERYTVWEFKGGQRTSLFNPGGAIAPLSADEAYDDEGGDMEDWNFSTSDSFNQAFGRRYSQMMFGQEDGPHFEAPHGAGLPPINTKDMTVFERMQLEYQDNSANRGERSLDRIWNPETTPYDSHTPAEQTKPEFASDLPLRNMVGTSAPRESTVMIDLDADPSYDSAPTFNFDFDDIPTMKAKTRTSIVEDDENDDQFGQEEEDQNTKRATRDWTFPNTSIASVQPKRATMDWTFPSTSNGPANNIEANMANSPPDDDDFMGLGRPPLKHTATVPLGQFGDFIHTSQPVQIGASHHPRDSVGSMIDLDFSIPDPDEIVRPSTASSTAGSATTDMTSGNPFDLEDDEDQRELDRSRFSYHKQWQSEGGNSNRSSLRTVPMHERGSSLSSTDSELERNISIAPRIAAGPDDVFNYDYGDHHGHAVGEFANTMRQPLHIGIPQTAPLDLMSSWPNFSGVDSADESPAAFHSAIELPRLGESSFPLEGGINTKSTSILPRNASRPRQQPPNGAGANGHVREGSDGEEVEFPTPVAPHPDVLFEDAPADLVLSELDRLLDDMTDAFRATSRVIRLHAGVNGGFDGGESSFDESDSGMESGVGGSATGDMLTEDEERF